MVYFARRVKYVFNELGFTAILEISAGRIGKPERFIVYRYGNCYDQKQMWRPHYEMIVCKNRKLANAYLIDGEEKWIETSNWLREASDKKSWTELDKVVPF